MFAKLAIIIVSIGLAACGLLAMRQARLQAAHELAQAQLRIARVDERLLTLHAEIAGLVTPGSIRRMQRLAGESARPADAAHGAAETGAGPAGAP